MENKEENSEKEGNSSHNQRQRRKWSKVIRRDKNRKTEYHKELYRPNEVVEGYESYVETLENFIEQFWKMTDDQNDELNDEEILKIIEDSEDKKATGPEGILSNEMLKKGGRSLMNSILRMLKMVHKTEKIPDAWNKAFIKNIYKGKGSKKEMNNYRGIILNPHIAKIFEKIVENKERSTLQNMSEYQCGARKGKSIREHHFTIRTIIEEARKGKEEITAVYFDIKKCFDKMVLKEAIKEM